GVVPLILSSLAGRRACHLALPEAVDNLVIQALLTYNGLGYHPSWPQAGRRGPYLQIGFATEGVCQVHPSSGLTPYPIPTCSNIQGVLQAGRSSPYAPPSPLRPARPVLNEAWQAGAKSFSLRRSGCRPAPPLP